jgi:desumoylating isopeptidase 1
MLRLSPIYEEELSPLLEVLQAKETLKTKVKEGVAKKLDVKKLVEEVANKLCP